MGVTHLNGRELGDLLSRSARLNRAETTEAAVTHAAELVNTALDNIAATVSEYDVKTDTYTAVGSGEQFPGHVEDGIDEIPEPVLMQANERTGGHSASGTPEAVVDTDPTRPIQAEAFVPVGNNRVLRLGTTEPDGFDGAAITLIEGIAANLETALRRLDGRESKRQETADRTEDDAAALRSLNELTTSLDRPDDRAERLLSLGCEYLGLDTGILSHVDGDDYGIEAVVDATNSHETGAVYDLGETMCDVTLADDATDTLAFADVADTDYQNHPATENVQAYVAAPVVVDGDTYGTVNFSMAETRSEAFRPEEKEFVTLVAQWVGTEIERRQRFIELEQYETILEAVDDPVYALDTDGRFRFVNPAAEREFGYGEEVIGEHVSVGMEEADIERIQGQIEELLGTNERSTTVEFELQTGDGQRRTVENRLALIDDDKFSGSAGVLRDITDRLERERELESFQRAVEEAADGVAVLDEGEYVYVDQTHIDMYGFDTEDDLLGETWRKLYNDDEVARLEEVAFTALEAEGHWRGMVTGSRPDGSTFPAELSLTIVGDGRLVCTVRDETDRRERERRAQARVDLLERIYEVTTDPQTGFEEKVDGLLEAGREYLDLPYGFLTQIDIDDDTTAGTQTILEAVGSHELLQPGESGSLSESYCQRTIDQENVLALTDAAESELVDDLAYDTFELETYIGGNVTVDDDVYGTLCFASHEPREASFDEFERSVIRLLGEWAGYEIERRDAREELRQQQERLELTLSGTNTGIAEWNLETDELTSDHTFVDLVGTDADTAEEFFQTVMHPGDRERVRETLERNLDAGEPTKTEYRVQTADVETRWLQSQAVPTLDDDGNPVSVLAMVTDITDRKTEERERRRNERRFESLFDDPGMLVGLLDTDGKLLNVNATAMEYVEGTAEDLRGKPFPKTPWWNHSETLQNDLRKWIGRAAGGEYVEYSAAHRGRDGDRVYVDGAVRPVTDVDGTVTSLLISARDVTERERQHRELQNRQRKLELVLSNTDTSVAELDLEHGTVQWDEMAGNNDIGSPKTLPEFFETVHPEDRERVQSAVEAIADGDRQLSIQFRFVEPDVSVAWVAAQAVPVTNDGGEPTGKVVGIATDITELKQREQALFEEREQFRLLTESVDEYAFLTVDEDGRIQTWNAGAENLLGYDADTAIGMSMAELHPESERESDLPERLLQQARISGESAHEGWRVRADGSEFYADVRYAPLESDDGEFRGYAKVVRDMTDRRRQQRRTERFVEEANDVVAIVDTDGTIEYASGSADRILGYDSDDLVGENLFDYLHPESREDAMETFFTGLEDPDADLQAECRIESGDGEWLNVEGQCRNMLDDDAVGGMLLYLRDVTESKERARRFESIFNQTFQFTGLLEPDGTVIEVNDAALEFGGFERSEIVGNRFFNARWWTHSEVVRDNARDAIEQAANGEFVRYETEVRGGDGLVTIDFSVKPVRDEDDNVSLLVVEGRDITVQQQHRRHLEVMQRVMRHNMRNDLTKMRAWTQMMSEEEDAKQRAEQLEAIQRTLGKWESMTEKMKDIRQALQSNGEWNRMEASLLIEDAVGPVREQHSDVTILTEVPNQGTVQMRTPLVKAVRELVANAADASENPTVEVEISRPTGDWVGISVRDDGPGMPEMEADVLETGEETPLRHGQGIGLWMVRTVVTQVGGDVSVESTTDGTTVRLRVPRAQTAGERFE